MKLITTIPHNAEGVVIAHFGHKHVYEFTLDESTGEVSGDVDNQDHVAHLLGTGNFFPHDESDYQEAAAIIAASDENAMDDLDEDEDDIDPDAAPVESETPKSNRKPRKAAE